jgi:acetylornithine deacetylase/succinyl-diaminopimelate desuccinylase-like protein
MKDGIPSIGYSARGGEKWHSDDEFVYVSSILDTAKIYALTILNLK